MNSRKVKQRTKRGFTNRRTKGKCEGKTGRTREEKRSSGYMEGEEITERMIYLKFGESRNFSIFIVELYEIRFVVSWNYMNATNIST